MEELVLQIKGMSCGHCVGQVTKALSRLETVQVHRVQVGEARVAYDRTEIAPPDIVQALSEAGYEAQAVGRDV